MNPAPTRALRLWFEPHQQATSHEQLVQILLPTRDNRGRKFKSIIFGRIRKELVGRFGGLTAYSRFPACGVWKSGQSTKLDDIIATEIVTAELNGVGGKNIDASWSVRSARTVRGARADDQHHLNCRSCDRVIIVRDAICICSSSDEGHKASLKVYHQRYSCKLKPRMPTKC